LASRLVINQPDAVSNIAVPTFETKLAVHITVNARCPNGPHREGVGAAGAAAVVRSAPKRISRRGIRAPGKRLVNQPRNTFYPTFPR